MKRVLSWLAVVLYFVGLTVLMTWPLVLHFSDALTGRIGDNIYFVWMIGWFKKALFDLHANPFNIWFLNYPQGWNLAYTEITPIMLTMAMPFTFIGSLPFAYNMAMMLTFVLAGIGMFLWVRSLTNNNGAALVGGTIYAFLPYHFAHFLIGHLNLSAIQWFPFYFWGFFDLLDTLRKGLLARSQEKWIGKAVLTGVSLGLIGLSSQYYLYMTLLISAVLGIGFLFFIDKKQFRQGSFWKKIFLTILVSLPFILIAVAPFVSLAGQGGLPDRDLESVRQFSASASPTDFVLPSTDHFLWGAWVNQYFNRELWAECTLYIGVVAGTLAVLAFIKRKKTNYSWMMVLMLLAGSVAFILALGPDLRWFNERVVIQIPDIFQSILQRSEVHVPMPGLLLFKYLPFYAKLRAFARFGFFVLIFTSVSAGIGAAWLLQKVKPLWRNGMVLILLALVLVDFYPGPYSQFAEVKARAVDTWLAAQPGDEAIIQMPFVKGEDQEQIYYTLIHGKPFVGGFFNAFPPEQYLRITPVMATFPDQASVALMRQLKVKFVLVDEDEYADPAKIRATCETLGLKFVIQLEDQMVFKLTDHHE